MTEPIVNVSGMDAEVRRCALALLPVEANGTWVRAVAGEPNLLGEGSGEDLTWGVRVFWIDLFERRGEWTSAGIIERGSQRILMAPGVGVEGLEPRPGDELVFGGVRYRCEWMQWLPVDGAGYWQGMAVRIG
jgi:hypothetical protein